MKEENAGEVFIEDRNLAVMTKQIKEMAKTIQVQDFQEKINRFAKWVYAVYEKDRARNQKKSLLKRFIDKINPFNKDKIKEEERLNEEQTIIGIKNTLFIAIADLRSTNSIDSPENDLNLTRKLEVVAKIATNCKVPAGVAEEASQAIGRITNTSGNSVNSLRLSAEVQDEKVNVMGTAKSMRYNLSGHTSEVPISDLPITDAARSRKELETQRFLEESKSLSKKGG